MRFLRLLAVGTLAITAVASESRAQSTARISEELRVIETYPFSEPDPVPELVRDERLYPYHRFQGYAAQSRPKSWKVVTLENDYITVYVLPEVGGKVWGAVINTTGQEFIYRNEVMKFRNIALRGPWTSGGIEFNFGVIGHTPSTATPVDYTLLENPDGSVSCVVGAMDLPSRTHWRVEIRLEPDKAYFETNVLWYNPTATWQPYYNWMTAAAFARDDLRMFIPGNRYLGHPGESHAWPYDAQDRFLPDYAENRFGGHKSFHVVGVLDDHFGGYYMDDGYGFGHWARHEEMPGQKLWLWALSRQGGIWEDLLTDTDGQYVEYQAGRQHVQYAAGSAVNPIREATFEPGATDRWEEIWYPVVGIGGMSDVTRRGVLHVTEEGEGLRVGINAFEHVTDTLRVVSGDGTEHTRAIRLEPLEVFNTTVPRPSGGYKVQLPAMGLGFSAGDTSTVLRRPFQTESEAWPSIPEVDRWVAQAQESIEARRLGDGRTLLDSVLVREPWNREALLLAADLDYRSGSVEEGLRRVERVRQLDAYDPRANFVAGNLYRAANNLNDAREAYGWAARSVEFRAAAYTELADLAMRRKDWDDARHYSRQALDFGRHNLRAMQNMAILDRLQRSEEASPWIGRMLQTDPLSHDARAERYLASGATDPSIVLRPMRSEFRDQSLLEVVIGYARRGLTDDAFRLLQASADPGPLETLWLWHLEGQEGKLPEHGGQDLAFVFPYRAETASLLAEAVQSNSHWSWTYLYALNLWGLGHRAEAAALVEGLGERPDLSSFYIARAHLRAEGAESDLHRAQAVFGEGRLSLIHLIRFYQDEARWQEALEVSQGGRARYPTDFNLDLLHAKSLLHLNRAEDALAVLGDTHVLPSENARESHALYQAAHLLRGMDILEADPEGAVAHFRSAMEWPEHLGQGKPYSPDERLPEYLLGLALGDSGRQADAAAAFERVLSGGRSGNSVTVAALRALGRTAEAERLDEELPRPSATGKLSLFQEVTRMALAHGGR